MRLRLNKSGYAFVKLWLYASVNWLVELSF
jgi:hypothetical protein